MFNGETVVIEGNEMRVIESNVQFFKSDKLLRELAENHLMECVELYPILDFETRAEVLCSALHMSRL